MLKLKQSIVNTFVIITLVSLLKQSQCLLAENVCTFHVEGSLFSLVYLQKQQPYKVQKPSENKFVLFNFCASFVPNVCPSSQSAYSFLVKQKQLIETTENYPKDYIDQSLWVVDESTGQNQDPNSRIINNFLKIHQSNQLVEQIKDDIPVISYQCQPYSSNSYGYLFEPYYNNQTLKLILFTQKPALETSPRLLTQINIQCSTNYDLKITNVQDTPQMIKIYGRSKYGCPVFQVSSLWSVFQDNWILIGILFIIAGVYLLFYGRVTLFITVFLTAYFLVFAVLAAISTLFISPYSSTFVIYFTFLVILFVSTITAYSVSKLLDISIFFIGAFLGFILGVLINSIFAKITGIYSVWALVIFIVILAIPIGLLTFKYSDEIIIASTSLTGAYLIVRPISWIFGGFPNQFLLYHMVETKQLQTLPWAFFLYLLLIIILAIIGALYQILKFEKQRAQLSGDQIEANYIQQRIEGPIDKIKLAVDRLVQRYRPKQTSQQKLDQEEIKDSGKYYKMQDFSKSNKQLK